LLAVIVPKLQLVFRYSDRKTEHWFHSEKNGLSIAGEPPSILRPTVIILMVLSSGTSFLPQERVNDATDKVSPQDLATDGRLRRAQYTSSIEKRIIKDSMAKVIGIPKAPLQRLAV